MALPSPLALAGQRSFANFSSTSAAAPPATLRLVLQKICGQVQKRQTRVDEFIHDFDKLRSGSLSRESFIRALGLAGLTFTPAEAKILLSEFAAPGDASQITYTAFLAAIDDFIATQPASAAEPAAIIATLSVAEEARIEALLEKMRYVVTTRGIIVKDFLGDFDTLNTGYVTEAQFLREFAHCFPTVNYAEPDVNLIMKKFAELGIDGSPRRGGVKRVNYRMLSAFTGGPPPSNMARSGVVPQRPLESTVASNAIDTEARLAAHALQRRIAVDAIFPNQSRTRGGVVARIDFVRSLTDWGAGGVSGKGLENLADAYAGVKGATSIPYGSLLTKIASLGSISGVAADRINSVGSDAAQLDAILKFMCAYMLRHGLDAAMLDEKFRGFDANKEKHTSGTQFERVLRSYELTPTKPADLALLKRCVVIQQRFCAAACAFPYSLLYASAHLSPPLPTTHPRTNSRYVNTANGRINFAAFVSEVASYEKAANLEMFPPQAAVASPVRAAARARAAEGTPLGFSIEASKVPAPTIKDVMRKIRTATKQSGVRLRQFFADADPLRSGLISVNQFESGVDSAGFSLNPIELALISASYGDAIETDPSGRPLVRWSTMCDDVNSIFTLRHLEQTPTLDVDAGIAQAMTAMMGVYPRLSAEEQASLAALLASVQEHIARRRIQLVPTFEGFDKLKRGIVTEAQFDRSLSIAGLHTLFSRQQLAIVKRAFAAEPCTPDQTRALLSSSLFSYRWFLFALADPTLVTRLPPMDQPMSVPPGEATVAVRRSPMNRRSGRVGMGSGTDGLATVVDKIVSYCALRSIRLSEFFPDYDELRRGCMPQAKLRTALASAGIDLDEYEIRTIEAAYAHPEALFADMVLYPKLVAAVDAGLVARKLALAGAAPLAATPTEPIVAAVIAQIQTHVAERSIDVMPVFVARDRNRTGVVTLSKFMGGLDFLGVFELRGLTRSGPAIAALLAEFKTPDRADFKSNASNYAVDYARFSACVDVQ